MKIKIALGLSLLAGLGFFLFSKQTPNIPLLPAPTNGTIVFENAEEGENQGKREAWIEAMHRTAPGTDWRQVEHQTAMEKHQKHLRQRAAASSRSTECEYAEFSNGSFKAEWRERGSVNQAGNVLVTAFDVPTETIFTVSGGGTLWRGNFEGTSWEPVNQDFRFGNGFLEVVPTTIGRRVIAELAGIPQYSDDDGATWTTPQGLTAQNNGNTRQGDVIMVNNAPVIYLISKAGNWANLKLYESTDLGETYNELYDFGVSSWDLVAMDHVKGSTELAVLLQRTNGGAVETWKLSETEAFAMQSESTEFSLGDAKLTAVNDDGESRLYTYDQNLQVWTTGDYGTTWEKRGVLPTSPWNVGIYVSELNPDLLIYGEVECYRSLDGGMNFNKVNGWGEYYGNVEGKLHADIMYIDEVISDNGLNFITISNHGGLSISLDNLTTTQNISLAGLNVSQYYDVATDPVDKKTIYAGSQDQGFQRSTPFNDEQPLSFDQVISGDYGHTAFSENGYRLWTVYPGGWVTYYPNPLTGNSQASWELNSNHESVWIPPLVTGPDPSKNEIFMAGGNAFGGDGSFLIKLSAEESNGNYSIKQDMDFYDFRSVSGGGEISYIAFSPVNPDHWYVSTTNGRFFYSSDAGQNWDQNVNFLPGSHYLYGAAIHPSETDENTVYYGGSGYNNPAVYVSTDNGFTFIPMDEGLPNTMVFELDGNEDDSKIFAATEAGPYVYNQIEQRWYDLATACLPNQTYWSVEYLEETETARFGTYGRGIWDLAIGFPVSTETPGLVQKDLKVFPNPTTGGPVTVLLPEEMEENLQLQVHSLDGKMLLEQRIAPGDRNLEVDLDRLAAGSYEFSILTPNTRYSQRVVVQ